MEWQNAEARTKEVLLERHFCWLIVLCFVLAATVARGAVAAAAQATSAATTAKALVGSSRTSSWSSTGASCCLVDSERERVVGSDQEGGRFFRVETARGPRGRVNSSGL